MELKSPLNNEVNCKTSKITMMKEQIPRRYANTKLAFSFNLVCQSQASKWWILMKFGESPYPMNPATFHRLLPFLSKTQIRFFENGSPDLKSHLPTERPLQVTLPICTQLFWDWEYPFWLSCSALPSTYLLSTHHCSQQMVSIGSWYWNGHWGREGLRFPGELHSPPSEEIFGWWLGLSFDGLVGIWCFRIWRSLPLSNLPTRIGIYLVYPWSTKPDTLAISESTTGWICSRSSWASWSNHSPDTWWWWKYRYDLVRMKNN